MYIETKRLGILFAGLVRRREWAAKKDGGEYELRLGRFIVQYASPRWQEKATARRARARSERLGDADGWDFDPDPYADMDNERRDRLAS